MKQKTWEIWFILSCIIFLSLIFIGTLEGSKQFCPNWLYYTSGSIINMLAAIYVGVRTPSEDDDYYNQDPDETF